MNRAQPIYLSSSQIDRLLDGEEVELVHKGGQRRRGESYPIVLREHAELRVLVTSSIADPTTTRRAIARGGNPHTWLLKLALDTSERPLLLGAESKAAITPLSESYDEDDPEAHGYVDTGTRALVVGTGENAGDLEPEAVPHDRVKSSAASQEAAERFAAQKVDVLAKRRAKSTGNRVREALMQARAHRIDSTHEQNVIEDAVRSINEKVRRRAA